MANQVPGLASPPSTTDGRIYRLLHIQELRKQVIFPFGYVRDLPQSQRTASDKKLLEKLLLAKSDGTLFNLRDEIDSEANTLTNLLTGPDSILASHSNSQSQNSNLLGYLLIFASDLIEVSPTLRDCILAKEEPYKILLSLITKDPVFDSSVSRLATDLLTELLQVDIAKENPRAETVVPFLYRYLSKYWTEKSDRKNQIFATSQLCRLLGNRNVRTVFWRAREVILDPLVVILQQGSPSQSTASNLVGSAPAINTITDRFAREFSLSENDVGSDLVYWILRVLWQLSFNAEEVAEEMQRKYDILALSNSLLRHSYPRVINVVLGLLVNVLTIPDSPLLPAASMTNLRAAIPDPNRNVISSVLDTEAIADINTLITVIETYTHSHTTLDDYISEVISKNLKWTPTHSSLTFWDDHAQDVFDYKSGALINILADILVKRQPSTMTESYLMSDVQPTAIEISDEAQCIACSDLIHITRRVPESRTRLKSLHVRPKVMDYMVVGSNKELRQLCLDLVMEGYTEL